LIALGHFERDAVATAERAEFHFLNPPRPGGEGLGERVFELKRGVCDQ
jgi:hypothetical protein